MGEKNIKKLKAKRISVKNLHGERNWTEARQKFREEA
jgi:hypothetical protein